VYGIITQAGGYARIYSEGGMGTTFSALFPVTEEITKHLDEPAHEPRAGGGETILLVEDEAALLEVARRILTRNGYRVIPASGGGEALVLAEQHQGEIDLLITDVVMPNMQGKQVAETITRLCPAVRVLYMSGYARPVLAARGTLETGVALLEKPFSERTMLDKVREILGK
jgi:CheY-like chemotaxis protein